MPTIDSNIPNVEMDGQVFKFRALDHIAYQWAYDEFYRNENLQEEILNENRDFLSRTITDDEDLERLLVLRYRNWSKDYFTSALPNTQRGIDVGIPITADVPISYNPPTPSDILDAKITRLVPLTSGPQDWQENDNLIVGAHAGTGAASVNYLATDGGATSVDIDNSDRLIGHLSNVVATVNDLRLSVALQSWAEASMRGGARYPEILMSTFGVRPRDARLDRPECMGRVSFPCRFPRYCRLVRLPTHRLKVTWLVVVSLTAVVVISMFMLRNIVCFMPIFLLCPVHRISKVCRSVTLSSISLITIGLSSMRLANSRF